MVVGSNSLALQFLGNYQGYAQSQSQHTSVNAQDSAGVTLELSAQSKALANEMANGSFGSVRLKASSSVMNVVLSNLQGTASSAI